MFGFGNGENTSNSAPLIIREDDRGRDNLIFGSQGAIFLLILGLILVVLLLFGQNNRFLSFSNVFGKKKDKDKDPDGGSGNTSNSSSSSNNNTSASTGTPVISTSSSSTLFFPIFFGTGLRPQAPNPNVKELQTWLNARGFSAGLVDGRWGNLTEAARKAAGLPGRFSSRPELERFIGRGGTFAGASTETVVFK